MIGKVLPSAVVGVDTFGDPPQARLLPAEEPAVVGAVEMRRREFTTVRHCARAALARLGLPAVAVLPGPDRAPRWPDGVVGSMTHCDGYRAAAVARVGQVRAVGIDAEPNEPLPSGVPDLVLVDPERSLLTALAAADPAVRWDRLVFSAKEAVYKAVFPLTGQWLEFTDVLVRPEPPTGRFTARAQPSAPAPAGELVEALGGRFVVGHGLVVTSAVLV